VVDRQREDFPSRPGIIFMGTPDFSVPSLKALIKKDHNILAVVTQPDRPKGRGRKTASSPVKKVATEFQIEVLQPEKASDPLFCEEIRRKDPDLLIVVAFGQILKKSLLHIPSWGALNVHASLLPKYRGPAPIHWAILEREDRTGLTAMKMDEGLDTGPILFQKEIDILDDDTAGVLHDRLARLSGEFLIKTLEGMATNRFKERPQNQAEATYAPKIGRNMSLIEWDQRAHTVSALIRALDPWPGAHTTFKGRKIKVFSARVSEVEAKDAFPGSIVGQEEGAIFVQAAEGLVEIKEMQMPGKKRLATDDFLRGFPMGKGTILGS
jgi:methionyl-tRNA formyltransferase